LVVVLFMCCESSLSSRGWFTTPPAKHAGHYHEPYN